MVGIKSIPLLLLILLVAPLTSRSWPQSQPVSSTSLFAQSSSEALNHEFPNQGISFLLLDANTGQVLAARWDQPDVPIPLGSLLKPFAALAYGEQHDFRYPAHTCRGVGSGCWRPAGHGVVDLRSAIAYSCNSYFRLLTTDLTAAEMSATAARFGLQTPDHEIAGAELAGLGQRWRVSPLQMAHAYLELARQRDRPGVRQILDGMSLSGQRGTGAEVDRALRHSNALVKTGTATCTHSSRAPGDGSAVALFPADDPRILLMVRVHGVPGSQAAKTAGQMLHRIED